MRKFEKYHPRVIFFQNFSCILRVAIVHVCSHMRICSLDSHFLHVHAEVNRQKGISCWIVNGKIKIIPLHRLRKRGLSLFLKRKGKTNEQKDRFARLSEIELEECKKKPGCKNTDKSQLWAFCVFEAWIENQCGSEPDDDQIRYKESDLYADDAKRVCLPCCANL